MEVYDIVTNIQGDQNVYLLLITAYIAFDKCTSDSFKRPWYFVNNSLSEKGTLLVIYKCLEYNFLIQLKLLFLESLGLKVFNLHDGWSKS